eukprot:2867033-Karenia_brevis.AAC.1
MWLSCLLMPEFLYRRPSDGAPILCLGNESGMGLGLIMNEHTGDAQADGHIRKFYTYPDLSTMAGYEKNICKMFVSELVP